MDFNDFPTIFKIVILHSMQIVKFILILFAIVFTNVSFAQTKQQKYKAGYLLNIGTASYVGDLTSDVQSITFQPALGIGVFYNINRFFAIRSEASYFRLSGKKYISTKDYLGFTSNNSEISTTLIYNITPEKKQFISRNANAFYLFAGIGLASFQSKVEKSGDVLEFRSINQSPFSGATAVVPMGLGLKFKTTPSIDISVEVGFRKSFSDYLDNITPFHNSLEQGGNNQLVTVPADDSKPGNKDSYFFTTFKIIYTPKFIFKKKAKSATATTSAAAKRNKKTSLEIRRSRKLENTNKTGLGSAPH